MAKSFKKEVASWMDRNGIEYIDLQKDGKTIAKLEGNMAIHRPKTEAAFTVKSTNDDMASFDKPQTVKFADDTGNMAWGDYTFKITVGNMLNLETLCKYAQMLDYVTHSIDADRLNIDGVVNEVLAEALSKRVKELAKKHGFESAHDFTEALDDCHDGGEVEHVIRESEQAAYQRAHNKILMHVPFEDRQKSLFDDVK